MLLQDALRSLEMARFTRRYPVVLETLMKQMLAMVHVRKQQLALPLYKIHIHGYMHECAQ